MSNNGSPKSFWTTLPGILAGSAALITAIGGLVGALFAAGVIGPSDDSAVTPPPTGSQTAGPTSTSSVSSIPKPVPKRADTPTPTTSGDISTLLSPVPTPSAAGPTSASSVSSIPTPVPTRADTPTSTASGDISTLRSLVPTPSVALGDDHGNFPANATDALLNTQVSGKIEPVGDVDYLNFTAQEGVKYAFEYTGLTTSLKLVDADGVTQLAQWVVPGIPKTWTAPASGTYFIKVSATTRTGNYTLTVLSSLS